MALCVLFRYCVQSCHWHQHEPLPSALATATSDIRRAVRCLVNHSCLACCSASHVCYRGPCSTSGNSPGLCWQGTRIVPHTAAIIRGDHSLTHSLLCACRVNLPLVSAYNITWLSCTERCIHRKARMHLQAAVWLPCACWRQ